MTRNAARGSRDDQLEAADASDCTLVGRCGCASARSTPTPRQEAFLRLHDTRRFFGGAAGGGKSIALLMAALQYADVPGYHACCCGRA